MHAIVRVAREEGRYYAPIEMPHLGHSKPLCYLVEVLGVSIEGYKPLVRNAKFLHRKCGRVAANEENFREPIKL